LSTSKLKNTILNEDCVTGLAKLDENSIDLVVTSPPYDGLRDYKGFTFEFPKIVKGLFRVLKQGGVVVWVVADATIKGSETGTSFKQALGFLDAGFNLHDTMIFRKKNPIPQIYRKRYNNEFEYMFVFSKGVVNTHNSIMVPCLHAGLELGSTTYKNYSKKEQTRTKMANPVKAEKVKGNVWEYVVGKNKEDQEAKDHPAPFPAQLARDHIMSWSNVGDTVLDPMCGSGTTLRVAKELDRVYIGMDISEEYCKIAERRVANANQVDAIDTVQKSLI
jgi:site-specific DNA-methyltransferase (adenine-specific)